MPDTPRKRLTTALEAMNEHAAITRRSLTAVDEMPPGSGPEPVLELLHDVRGLLAQWAEFGTIVLEAADRGWDTPA